MSAEAKRKAELFLCARLTTAVTGQVFIPWKGGSDITDETEMEPPFTIVGISNAEDRFRHPGLATYLCTGNLQIISHSAEATTREHAAVVKLIHDALKDITALAEDADFTLEGTDIATGFCFNGLDITAMRTAEDEENQVWADIIDFTMGVSTLHES
jgi:hypothetical protein